MRKFFLAAALAVPFAASATNLVKNGSFETGTFSDWTVTGAASDGNVVAVKTLGTNSFFGETVVAENAAAGTKAAYFVSDKSNETLSQSVYLAAGSYDIGFSAYAPLNGIANAGAASFSGVIAGETLADYSVSIGGAWTKYSGTKTITADGFYDITFAFNTSRVPSKDIVIDSVYVVATTPVPEPESYAMMLAGLGVMGVIARRRKAKAA